MSNDVVAALKGLSLHGMAGAWPEVLGTARMKSLDHEALMHQLLRQRVRIGMCGLWLIKCELHDSQHTGI